MLEDLGQRWASALAEWAIPEEILARAERDPWGFPVARFADRADRALKEADGISFERAAEVLRVARGSVLDVGAGAGAASLPLAHWATKLTAVDVNEEMLAAFSERATGLQVEHREALGSWPQIAGSVEAHDVVVAHHVVYNVPDIVPFLSSLTDHARRRVVIELPPHHPLTWMAPLWKQFHDLDRPQKPLAGDIVEMLSEMGVGDLRAEYWARHDPVAGPTGKPENPADRAVLVTRRLCLPESREPEVAQVLADVDLGYHREVVTISWAGSAG